MARSRPRTKADERKLRADWNKRLAAEGLGVMGDSNHWTFPGITAKGVGFTSLDAVDSDGSRFDATELFEADNERDFGKSTKVADTPTAIFFRRFLQAAHDLPRTHLNKGFIIAVGECGYVDPVARKFGIGRAARETILRRFCAAHDFDFDTLSLGVQPSEPDPELCHRSECHNKPAHSPHSAPARRLSKAEIKRLRLTPPSKSPY